ncbi:MAG TPA: CBS domain-containing protein [Roseiarcus sp.]
MTSAVISATGETPVRDIAQLLLQKQISGVPILDQSGAPIGMVSEGAGEERQHRAEELIGKHNSDGSWCHLLHEARTAAEQGLKEFLLLRFPSQVCSDGPCC